MPKAMAKRYFQQNEQRIKQWIEQRYDSNPEDVFSFEEFVEEFPADAGWDKPTLDWFFEEYLSNLLEFHQIQSLQEEMERLFDNMLDEFLEGIEEQEAEHMEFQREYREVAV